MKTTFDFEKPIADLQLQIEKVTQVAEKTQVDMSATVRELEEKLASTEKEIYGNLTGWQNVQMSRHPDRPQTYDYIEAICDEFIELHGDRTVKDDKAIVGGMASIDGNAVMIIGHQKGKNTKERQFHNFGMANPEGYRKALRLMKMAEKFNKPVITLIDTMGAYPGLEAEERGQGEAIARNLMEMAVLKVPIICVVIGEGASGGALGIGVGNRVYMMEHTWYSVISPESCSSILWRSWDHKEKAAEALKLTSEDMLGNGLIDGIIPEPLGGAHQDPAAAAANLKSQLLKDLAELTAKDSDTLVTERIDKFSKMGVVTE
ncbi:Acetyl-coenzyme A carboxylase carboxyl transferase subunit alpha [compost metagenome]|jgi:acetyl-CoA carboxylase carboxyl transferase subunit alpha|uniref:Acetyl-coenzyme A carboxylase carboxyl transferase subunit alpha n=1 Tax=Sphingobacterium paramultivorum TaxID=2886510 RepID=A0A7G5E9S8_9SPHI|nr:MULTISPECIES: acetyl-CoA carboxylase carboxyltransferase subunit alpha [Sphingobacterium]MBB1647830.1 acetyl-CoA carboxylase carboxyltransferase subunit alpha [Sphingobacterium sp. UME9]MDR3010543.1 acetyl-CoA carboxylase carboxyltransferase subunit alpha [Sphingobacterium sp.]QMV70753.1 acetyl-CoA carboxylase carboxyltransferase subunit alpha [Sphingobacterium paramultivorum]WET71820.1 MAG: acetyl-CoA carboxylase carboxyltransferase subunit alpha [Sphingobacterium sp.]WSO14630.1 acetyl-CoA